MTLEKGMINRMFNKLIIKNRASAVLFNFLCNKKGLTFAIPANICSVVPMTFKKADVPFKLVDIDMETLGIDLDIVENLISNNEINGVYYVHPYGATIKEDIERLKKIKGCYPTITLINDKCLCIPEFGENLFMFDEDLILYSTGYSKVVDIGIGGYGYIRGQDSYKNVPVIYDQNEEKRLFSEIKESLRSQKEIDCFNMNWLNTRDYNGDEKQYQKAVLDKIEATITNKEKFNSIFESIIPDEFRLPSKYNYWRFNVLVPDNQLIINKLFNENLFASAHYPSLGSVFGQGEFENAKYIENHIINLFNDKRVNTEMVIKTAEIVKSYL